MTTTAPPAAATLTIDGRAVPFAPGRNLLESIRATGIDLPTFCYHSELSVYGACRLCIVDIEGRGIQASCSVVPEPGMVVKTQTAQLRDMRRMTLELLLANHDDRCPTCDKAATCRLQDLARRLGVDEVRFQRTERLAPPDNRSLALKRDAAKCILCGDCVRMCAEVQGIGAIDFAHRGARTVVQPAFDKCLDDTACVLCGQCARVCPTGALTPRNDLEPVWKALTDPHTTVVVQIAPAVRVALGEAFGLPPGTITMGRMVAALRRLGFAQVFDTSFTADLTIVEEAGELLERLRTGERLPLFTSCCPAWVKYVEQFHPELLGNLSTCKSPQQMFGSLARKLLPQQLGVEPAQLKTVAIMPCTAKKFEASRPEFAHDGQRDVDWVLTTQELARMIQGAGIAFDQLVPENPDLPFGFKTGAGVLFGNSGGVGEAVLRYANAVAGDGRLRSHEFTAVRGRTDLRAAVLPIAGRELRLAVVSGLGNAAKLVDDILHGRAQYDIVEVMACPGGCVGGAGQPVSCLPGARERRADGIYEADRAEVLRNSADNLMIGRLYHDQLGAVGGHEAHHLLHTSYRSRKRVDDLDLLMTTGEPATGRLVVTVCLGTACHQRHGQKLLTALMTAVTTRQLDDRVEVRATFCHERCGDGPNVTVGERLVTRATEASVLEAIAAALGTGIPA